MTAMLKPSQQWWLALLCWGLWSASVLLVPAVSAVDRDLVGEAWQVWGTWLVLAVAWVVLWTVLHRVFNGEQTAYRYALATGLVLFFGSVVLRGLMSVLWFAMGWPAHAVMTLVLVVVLAAVLLRHHLLSLLGPGVFATWSPLAVGLALLAYLGGSYPSQHLLDPEQMPYRSHVLPAEWVLESGGSTAEVVDRLMTDEP